MAESAPSGISVFDPYIDADNVQVRWKSWLSRFENYLIAMNITNIDRRKALLLYYGGEHIFKIQEKICQPDDIYNEVTGKLTSHFNLMVPQAANTPKKQVTDLCRKCGKKHMPESICPAKGKQCSKCKNFNHSANVCRASANISNERILNKLADKITDKMKLTADEQTGNPNQAMKNDKVNKCKNCGKPHYLSTACPAKGKTCNKCKKLDHLDFMCKQNNGKPKEKHDDDKTKKNSKKANITHVQKINQTGLQINIQHHGDYKKNPPTPEFPPRPQYPYPKRENNTIVKKDNSDDIVAGAIIGSLGAAAIVGLVGLGIHEAKKGKK